ncbi:TRAP transporter small permease subunit [Parasedimentitalea maritima]|uniref:TRAP transporter small permease protein n=1 Tax=Parasedimentitalea maritima TaxID=2578117 RepID=A0ABY2URS5_9RHOB|nr:TRAP transporter small permease subunit [Zongyanglinia marina]TLP59450.1 TRAP transporter small permease subunit [Zongyanglinia marina]
MTGANIDVEQVLKITDPGELNRSEHLWGDRLVINLGNVIAWLFPILIVAIVTQVIIRKMGMNQAWLDDLQWWLYGIAMLSAFGYAITTDSHVRVDIFHANYSKRKQARIEVFGLGWLLLPFLLIMTDVLMHYAFSSIAAREGSDSPNGLHGLFLLKSALPLLFAVAIISTIATLSRNLAKLNTPALWRMILGGLPGFWFLAERATHYALWWIVHLSNPELPIRKVAREPIFDDTVWYGLGLITIIAAISFVLNRRADSEA